MKNFGNTFWKTFFATSIILILLLFSSSLRKWMVEKINDVLEDIGIVKVVIATEDIYTTEAIDETKVKEKYVNIKTINETLSSFEYADIEEKYYKNYVLTSIKQVEGYSYFAANNIKSGEIIHKYSIFKGESFFYDVYDTETIVAEIVESSSSKIYVGDKITFSIINGNGETYFESEKPYYIFEAMDANGNVINKRDKDFIETKFVKIHVRSELLAIIKTIEQNTGNVKIIASEYK